MKLIIAGSRTITLSPEAIIDFLRIYKIKPLEIVSGEAKGIDESGKNFYYSEKKASFGCNGLNHERVSFLKGFPADWNTHGKAAGPIRNRQMAEYADALLLIWDGKSRGSANMKKEMEKLGKPIYEVIIKC